MNRSARVLAVWSVPALLACGERVAISALGLPPLPGWRLVLTIGVPWYAWAAVTPVIAAVTRRYPLRSNRRPGTFAIHIVTCATTQSAYSLTYTVMAFLCGTISPRWTPPQYFVVTALGWIPVMTL